MKCKRPSDARKLDQNGMHTMRMQALKAVENGQHDLPAHPLGSQGYLSVGCMPCTRPYLDALGDGAATPDRGGRWSGQTKTECGLHTELANHGSSI